jgi:hypothetical protein
MRNASRYDTDFHAWAGEQAALLREQRFTEADINNIAEEIDAFGRSEKRALVSRLAVLLTHLLKWQFQPGHRGTSWQLAIAEQRRALMRLLRDDPSLRAALDEAIADAYGDALLAARRETGLAARSFPPKCPYKPAQIEADDFYPE